MTNRSPSPCHLKARPAQSHPTGPRCVSPDSHGERLDAWIFAVDADGQPHLHCLAIGLKRGYAAALNSLALPYSSGRGAAVIPGN